jgi:transposase
MDNVMVLLVQEVFPKWRNRHARRPHLRLDNCRVDFSRVAEQFIAQNHISRVRQPAYSPDLAPSDFWPFRHLKNSLAGWRFDDPEELLESITSFLEEVQPAELHVVFSQWLEMVRWVLENNGDDYHE